LASGFLAVVLIADDWHDGQTDGILGRAGSGDRKP
jgi:hypothetical protein